MERSLVFPLALAVLFGGIYLVNEWSEGGLAEAIGLGPGHHLHAVAVDHLADCVHPGACPSARPEAGA